MPATIRNVNVSVKIILLVRRDHPDSVHSLHPELRVLDHREAVLISEIRALLREVPALIAWFGAADAATTAELAQSDEVIEGLGLRAVGDPDDARWLVRVIVSLLIVPGRDGAEERRIVERYVVPGVVRGRR